MQLSLWWFDINLKISKRLWKICSLICKKYETKWSKIISKEIAYYFLRFQRGGKSKRKGHWRICCIQVICCSVSNRLYTHGTAFSDICNFLVTGILNCEILFFVKWKTHQLVFYLSCQTVIVIFEMFFEQSGRLRNKLIY